MPRISQIKKDKIAEQILHYLFALAPEARHTSDIAKELARDEEFTKSLLQEMQKKSLILEVTKNSKGLSYSKRRRWRLSDNVYKFYQQKQNNNLYNSLSLE